MSENIEGVEAIRARYRPERITILFVGELAPTSGDFFYCGSTAIFRHMQHGVERVLGESDDFLERFKSYGWYLDDLVLTRVNHLTKSQRKAKCVDAQNTFAGWITTYRPKAIVSLLMVIQPYVDAAQIAAGSNAPRWAVPFPGWGCKFASKPLWRVSSRSFQGWTDHIEDCQTVPPPNAVARGTERNKRIRSSPFYLRENSFGNQIITG